jgi:leader peptidase (prepilin peptidase)/N-methyltransferase
VNAVVIILYSVFGLFLASACWTVAFAQADRRPLFGGPVCADPDCRARLSPLLWLPFLGFGQARWCPECGKHYPRRRIAFELAVAGYFALVAFNTEEPERLAAVAIFSVPILIVLLVDWWTRYIYTNVIAAGLLLGFAVAALDGLDSLFNALLGAAGGAGIFLGFYFVAAAIYRSSKVVPFGMGDVYLAGMIGAMIGSFLAVIVALFYGIFFAGLGAVLLLVARRVSRRDPIPYGPYLCLGALVALLQQAW